jgi:hypothetical protein
MGVLLLLATGTTVITPIIPHPHPYEAAGIWTVYTLAGSVLAAGLSTLLKSTPDKGRLLAGRSLGAIVGGVFGSRITAVWYPQVWNWCFDPLLLVALSLVLGLFGYAVSYYAINLVDKAAPYLLRRWIRTSLDEETANELIKDKPKDKPEPKDTNLPNG